MSRYSCSPVPAPANYIYATTPNPWKTDFVTAYPMKAYGIHLMHPNTKYANYKLSIASNFEHLDSKY